jgi:hypothetical protein
MVGRSGSSGGVFPFVDDPVLLVVLVLFGVVEGSELSWRFMVGRSGSSAGVLPVAVVVPLLVVLSASEERRFMVGRSGSSVVAVLAEVVPGLGAGLLELLLAAGAASPFDLVVRWGWLASLLELVRTGSVLDGFRAVVVRLGAVSGLTDP